MSTWYCNICDAVSGPYSFQELRYLKNRGKLAADNLVRLGKNGDWEPAATVNELFPEGPSSSGSADPIPIAETPEPEPVPEISDEDEFSGEHLELEANVAANPPRSPVSYRIRQRQKEILIGTGIGAGVALLIVLLLLMLSNGPGGSHGTIAGHGVGDQLGQGVADGENGTDAGDENVEDSSGADTNEDEIVFEGEVSDEEEAEENETPQDNSTGDIPPEEESPRQALFTVRRLEPASTEDNRGNGASGGAGGGLGEFKDRLERAGGQSGEVQVTLIWNNLNDLDLHVVCPSGEEIYYRYRQSRCGGKLDVDMNAGPHTSREPVENIFWPEDEAPFGKFRVYVNHFRHKGGRDPSKFEVAIKYGGKTKKFSGSISFGQPRRLIHEFQHKET